MQNSASVGEVLLSGLKELESTYEVVGDVRGKGLMLAIEFVKNKVSLHAFHIMVKQKYMKIHTSIMLFVIVHRALKSHCLHKI